MEIAWHPDAQGEYDADVEWYEARGAGLGDLFEAAVDDLVYTVLEWPGLRCSVARVGQHPSGEVTPGCGIPVSGLSGAT